MFTLFHVVLHLSELRIASINNLPLRKIASFVMLGLYPVTTIHVLYMMTELLDAVIV